MAPHKRDAAFPRLKPGGVPPSYAVTTAAGGSGDTTNRLELLKSDRGGTYSIRIKDQWRVCFNWQNGDAYDVEIVDYH